MKNNLKILIIKKGHTTRDIAKKLNLNEQTITNWCNNRNINTLYTFYKLCKLLDCDIKDIFE